MFRFESPLYLYLLLLIPAFAAIHYIMAVMRARRLSEFGDKDLMRDLMPRYSKLRNEVKFWLCMAAFAIACVLLARPQYGHKTETNTRQGIEAIICLDISRSMLAQDVTPSRLDKAKMMVSNLVDNMQDDKIGLIIFAGDAFTQLPITSDYVSAKMFLDGITPDLIKLQGTDIANALTIATRSFTPNEDTSKAIIIITDGENHEGGAEEMAKQAADMGINIFVLGIGSPAGAPIPVSPGSNEFITDAAGQIVVSKLNDAMCKQIATAGQGAYIYVDNSSSAQKQLDEHISKMSKATIDSIVYSEFDEQFQTIAFILLLILFLELCVSEAKNPFLSRIRLFRRQAAIIVMLMMAGTASAQTEGDLIRSGNRCYRDSDYVKAEVYYHKAIDVSPRSALAYYNLACTQLRQRNVKEAMKSFETSVKMDTIPSRIAKTY
ncbi:MAG: VWA domain-containing protein, partial [Bacteroidaceae bacterium]|nr:VWA domain-containing protein [Bacteroidaceae bacterium]